MSKLGRTLRRVDDTGIPLLLARLGVGVVFVWLAYNKTLDPIDFMKLTHEYGVLPEQAPYLNLTAVVTPWIEIVCGVALILGIYTRGAAACILGMLLFFAPMLLIRAYGIYTDPANAGALGSFCDVKFDCGCGTGEVYICSKMVENVLLKVGALIALLSRSQFLCLGPALSRLRSGGQTEARVTVRRRVERERPGVLERA